MRKTICIFLTGLIVLSFAGCSKSEKYDSERKKPEQTMTEETRTEETKTKEKTIQETKISIPKRYKKEYSDSFICDIEIIADSEYLENPQVIKNAEIQNVNPDRARDMFLNETKIIAEDRDEGKGNTYIYLLGENGESFLYSDRTFHYNKPFCQYILQAFRIESGEWYNADQYSMDQMLPFMDANTAFETIVRTLKELEFEPASLEYKYYALDYKTLSEQEFSMDMDGNEDPSVYKKAWTQEDDCYYFVINQKVNGLPVYAPVSEAMHKKEDANAQIQVIFSKRGIEMLQIAGIMMWERNTEEVQLADFDIVMENVYKKYDMVLTDASYVVKNAEMVYMTEKGKGGNDRLKPVWIIRMDAQYTDTEGLGKNEIQLIMDAVSGKEIL